MNTGEKRLYVENTLSQQLIVFWLAGNMIFTLLVVKYWFEGYEMTFEMNKTCLGTKACGRLRKLSFD